MDVKLMTIHESVEKTIAAPPPGSFLRRGRKSIFGVSKWIEKWNMLRSRWFQVPTVPRILATTSYSRIFVPTLVLNVSIRDFCLGIIARDGKTW